MYFLFNYTFRLVIRLISVMIRREMGLEEGWGFVVR